MTRPRFDLGLFVVCTLPIFLFFAVAFAVEVGRRGWRDWLAAWIAGSAIGSLGIGFAIYERLRRAGYQWSRARPEEAEDYEDRE